MKYLTQIQAIVYKKINNLYKFLILKRTLEKRGFWQPITGNKQEKEKLEQAVTREVIEEIGIKEKDIVKIIYTDYKFNWQTKDKDNPKKTVRFIEYVFGVEIKPNLKITLSKEHENYKWCGYKEALSLIYYDTNKEGLRRLKKSLSKI